MNNQERMPEPRFVNAQQIAEMLGVSPSTAYKIIANLNQQLEAKGFITVRGRVPVKYLRERMYC